MARRTGIRLPTSLCAALLVLAGVVAGPATPAAAASTHDQDYVQRVFHAFLDRAPTSAEMAQATMTSMTTVAGRARLVGNLSQSDEGVRTTIDRLYVATLGRRGDPSGLAYWVHLVQARRVSIVVVAAALDASPEAFVTLGHSDVRTWVLDLYARVLGRDGASDPVGVDYWASLAEARGRMVVAAALLQSAESCRVRTANLYVTFLGRTPDSTGLAYWAGLLPRLGDLALSSNLAASSEYYGPLEAGQVVTPPPPLSLAEQLERNGSTTKVITVRSLGWTSTTAELTAWQRTVVGWMKVMGPWTANLGVRGFEKAIDRREGNGTTPTGRYGFATGFGLAANPGYRLGWFVVGPYDYWAEEPGRADYNSHQFGPANPALAPWTIFEHLVDHPVAYRYAAVILFNYPPAGPYGSGMFLHVSTGGPTAGCVSLPQSALLAVLPWIDAGTRIVMGPDSVIRSM